MPKIWRFFIAFLGSGSAFNFWEDTKDLNTLLSVMFLHLYAIALNRHATVNEVWSELVLENGIWLPQFVAPLRSTDWRLYLDAGNTRRDISNQFSSRLVDMECWAALCSCNIKTANKDNTLDDMKLNCSVLWEIQTPLHIKLFAWLLRRWWLVTKCYILRWTPSADSSCGKSQNLFCQQHEEDMMRQRMHGWGGQWIDWAIPKLDFGIL